MLGDEQALRDLVGAEMLVQEEQNLELARREPACDRLGDATVRAAAVADLLEQPPRDDARQRGLPGGRPVEEVDEALGRLGLQEVAGGSTADRSEQVRLVAGCRQHDDLAARGLLPEARQCVEPVQAGHRQVEQDHVGLQLERELDRLASVAGLPDDVEAVPAEQRGEPIAGQRVVVDEEDARGHRSFIGSADPADKDVMRRNDRDAYQAWLVGELLLVGLLGAALALFLAYPDLRTSYELPNLRLALDTGIVLAATIVAVLAGTRFSVEGRRLDLLLCAGFATAAGTALFFAVCPVLGGEPIQTPEAWAGVAGRILALGLIAAASFVRGRVVGARWALRLGLAFVAIALGGIWLLARSLGSALPSLDPGAGLPALMIVALAFQGLLSLVAVCGFGLRYRRYGEDLDRWLALAGTLMLSADLHYIFTPVVVGGIVSQGDFLRLLSYGLLLAGVWRAIRFAEFGRAVAEERARVAREIHDGLAQYLFAISTHLQMLEHGAPAQKTLPRLKEAASAAQQEARFAVLALSSASGNAPFGAALRRYVEFLTADGVLDVELEIDDAVDLAPDEQIEVFRIVQEGLANARKHARAGRARVTIGDHDGNRLVRIRDDGAGFEPETDGAGQGLRNMRARSASIGGGFRVRSRPGLGTAVEVTLRA